jgi:hypothetical protein
MNLAAAQEKYRRMRQGAQRGSGQEAACTKILICLDNARNVAEAKDFLTEEISNASDEFRKALYQEALTDLG